MDTLRSSATALLGRDHAVVGRNLQDHAVAGAWGQVAVAVVSDGCGEGAGSEVGARVSALVAARAARDALLREAPLEACVAHVGAAVISALDAVAVAVCGDDAPARARFAAEHLAATLWLAVARDGAALAFGWGDGVVRLGDRAVAVDEDGRPAYLLRAVGRGVVPPPSARFTSSGDGLIAVATDGWSVPDLAALPAPGGTPALLRWMRRRQREAAFRDDAAVAVLHRAGGRGGAR